MSKRWIKAGVTDQTIDVFIQDSTSTTGAGLTGLVFNTSGLTCYYRKGATGTPTALTLATQTVGGAHSDGGFVAVDGTNMPGVYRLDLSDTIVASAGMVTLYLRGAANMVPLPLEIEVVAADIYDGTRLGLTALPNVASGNAGAIITSGTGTAQLSVTSGQVTVATVNDKSGYSLSGSQTFSTSGSVGSVTGNVAGSVNSVVGTVTANTTQWGGTTVTGMPMPTYTQPTGFLAATFPTTVASSTNITAGTITTVTNVTNGVTVSTNNDKAGYSLATAPPTAAAIADAVWDESIGDHLTAGSTGAALNAAGSAGDPWTTTLPGSYTGSQAGKILADILVDTGTTLQAELDGIQADTEDIQSRLPAALVSGRMDASVGAMAANVLTASALATDAVTEVAGGVWNALTASYVVNGSFGERVLRSTNTQAEVQVNGNGHVASVLHSSEANSITVGAFAADSITASALAASAATEIATATQTSAMTESYRAAGVAPTLAQAVFELLAHMGDSSISGTTKTLKKIDGTTAKTFTLDSSTAPTSITEAT